MARRASRRPAGPPEPPGVEAAVEIALRFLAQRPRTRWELERRLRRSGAADSTIEATLERLGALGYVDDQAFVRWWAEQRDRHAPRGRRMVEAELRQRGVAREAIEAYRSGERDAGGSADDSLPATEDERAAAALERHLRGRPLPSDPRALQRIGMFLVRRGFDPETARSAIRRLEALDAGDA